MSELITKFWIHSTQIGLWKKQLLQEEVEVLKEETKGKKENKQPHQALENRTQAQLYFQTDTGKRQNK